jgi:hypothetical protein
MRRLKLLGIACAAVFALVAMATASASAFVLPEVLGPGAEAKFTTKDDLANPTFKTLKGNEVTCEHWSGEGGFEAGTRTLGLFHITFSGKCKGTIAGIKASCTGLGDAAETILVLGKWHTVVDTKPGETLGAAIMLLLEPVHFTCSIALVEVTGDILCLILEPLVSMVTHLFHCTETNGTANEKHFLNDAGAETAVPALLSSVSHATAEEAGETALGTITYGVPAMIDD